MFNFWPIVLLHSMIGYWLWAYILSSVCLSVSLSVTLCIVALRIGVQG